MSKQIKNNYEPLVWRIINDVYQDMVNMGLVNEHITPGLHTVDFDLPDGHQVRIKEQGSMVYYSIFRAK